MLAAVVHRMDRMRIRLARAGVKAFINRKIKQYGVMTKLEIDPKKKTLRIELDLKGETSPIVISAGGYELSEKEGSMFIRLQDLESTRPWVAALLNEFAAGKPLKLGDTIKTFAKTIL